MGRTKPPRRTHASDTERRIYEAAQQDRFKHQPQGFLEIWANIFMQLQDDDGFDTTFHTRCVREIMGEEPKRPRNEIVYW